MKKIVLDEKVIVRLTKEQKNFLENLCKEENYPSISNLIRSWIKKEMLLGSLPFN